MDERRQEARLISWGSGVDGAAHARPGAAALLRLATRIQQRSQNLLRVEESSLYPALQRLLKAGFVQARWEISATNRRVHTYSLTRKGSRHLEKEAARLDSMMLGIQHVLAPLSEPQS